MNATNIIPRKKRTDFYTVVFLNNYFPPPPPQLPEQSKTKIFNICEDSSTWDCHWIQNPENGEYNILRVTHNLSLPLTLEMRNAHNEPIFYCPILKDDIDSFTVGDITFECNNVLLLNFLDIPKPVGNEVFKLAMRSLPAFDLSGDNKSNTEEQQPTSGRGLAIIFRRNSLDALMDLLAEFDETYWHSFGASADLQYLTEKSCYRDCFMTVKYTADLDEVLELIDKEKYDIKFSWENVNSYY